MTKKEEKFESHWNESCNCGCEHWRWGIFGLSVSGLWTIFSVITCIIALGALIASLKSYEVSQKSYEVSQDSFNLNVLSAWGMDNFNRMNKVYQSDAYVEYATQNAEQAEAYFGLTWDENPTDTTSIDAADNDIVEPVNNWYSSLNNLKNIAINFGTDESALQTCIDEWRYVQNVTDMMNQASQLFGVNWTPGNVIVDRETGNYILVSGAYPVDEFVNAINEYKNGAENYIAGGDEVKNVVENMIANTPVRGDENARFTIIEYTELLCPFCQRHSQAGTINSVMEQFPWEVNSVSRHFIIHGDEALQLASTMECIAELNPSAYYETFEEAFKGL